MRGARIAAVGLGVAALLALAAGLSAKSKRAAASTAPRDSVVDERQPGSGDAPDRIPAATVPPPPAPIQAVEHADLIDDVVVDNASPCADEPTTITAYPRASVSGDELFVIVDGHSGNPGVVSFPSSGPRELAVEVVRRVPTATADKQIDRRTVRIDVRECRGGALRMTSQRLSDKGVYSLVARDADGVALPATGDASYQWDFGDGEVATTREPFVEHRFLPKPGAIQTTFLVTADAVRGGSRSHGIVAVALQNMAAVNRLRGRITPAVEVGPTSRGEDGRLHARLVVSNDEPVPLHLRTASATFVPCEEDSARDRERRAVDPAALCDTTDLTPGRDDVAMSMPEREIPAGTCLVQVELRGESNDGIPVFASAYLESGSFAPTRTIAMGKASADEDEQRTVRDLDRAIELLGRRGDPHPTVTDEELTMLRRQGRL
jgi:hypothetical protein